MFVISESDQTTYYYIEACRTLRIALAQIARARGSGGVRSQLAEHLGDRYVVENWQESNRSLFQALKLEKLGMGVILLLIVIVAAFNIISTLTMVVTDKTREIGILKTMGLTSRSVRRIFLGQGLVIGTGGTVVGVAIGLGSGSRR